MPLEAETGGGNGPIDGRVPLCVRIDDRGEKTRSGPPPGQLGSPERATHPRTTSPARVRGGRRGGAAAGVDDATQLATTHAMVQIARA